MLSEFFFVFSITSSSLAQKPRQKPLLSSAKDCEGLYLVFFVDGGVGRVGVPSPSNIQGLLKGAGSARNV